MQTFTTISQKGQIVVPKKIRDKLNLKPSDTLHVVLENDAIVARPVTSTDEVFGMFSVNKPVSRKNIKESFKKYLTKKFATS